jgi:hypothetical protein
MIGRLLKKTHMLRCAQSPRSTYRNVRLRTSIFARLASEIFLSSLHGEFTSKASYGVELQLLAAMISERKFV